MYGQDGMDGVQSTTSNTRNAPVEVIETYYPFLVRRYELIRGSAGAGQWRGGMGLRRELVIHSEASVGIVSDRQDIAPWGLEGGKPGGMARCYLVSPEGDEQRLIQKCTVTVRPATRLVLETAGGGGWGLASNRDPGAVESDLLNGYIDLEAAERDYGRPAFQSRSSPMRSRRSETPR
jgi:N-methylhydantoinase B